MNTEDMDPGYTFSALKRPHQLVKRVSCIPDEPLACGDQSEVVRSLKSLDSSSFCSTEVHIA